jgi:pyruvate dehydrogenase E1 component
MGSGVILREVIEAASILEKDFNVSSTIFSVTSFTEVRRNALDIQRWNMLNPDKTEKKSTLDEIIVDLESPIITATDYMKSFAEQIATFLPNKFISLGTDGFGRSDSREALRDFFEVDRNHIVVAALKALTEKQEIEKSVLLSAIKKYKIMNDKPNPVSL